MEYDEIVKNTNRRKNNKLGKNKEQEENRNNKQLQLKIGNVLVTKQVAMALLEAKTR